MGGTMTIYMAIALALETCSCGIRVLEGGGIGSGEEESFQ